MGHPSSHFCTSVSLLIFRVWDKSQCNIQTLWFDFYIPLITESGDFSYTSGHLNVFFSENVYYSPLPTFKSHCLFLAVEIFGFFTLAYIAPPDQVCLVNISPRFVGCLCTLLIISFAMQKLFCLCLLIPLSILMSEI